MIHFTGSSFTPAHFREMMHKFADGVHKKDYVKLSYLDYRYLRDQYNTYLEQDDKKFRVLAVYGSRIGTCRAEIIIIAPDASNPDGWVMVQSDDCSLGS
jgi:hypothetical protein